MDLVTACASGDHRDALTALRDELAKAMMEADANVKAQIAARLQAVLTDLAALPDVKGSPVDELIARRQARAATDAGDRPKRRRPRTESG